MSLWYKLPTMFLLTGSASSQMVSPCASAFYSQISK